MKRLILFFCITSYITCAHSMAGDAMLSVDEIACYVRQTQKKFGSVDYLEHAMHDLDGQSQEKFGRVAALFTDPQLIFFAKEPADIRSWFGIFCYKKDESARYVKIGETLFSLLDATKKNAYWLDMLQVNSKQRGFGVGTALFFYTQYVVRQLAYGESSYALALAPNPFGVEPRLDYCDLCKFYTLLGGKKDGEVFRWDGTPLKPWNMMEKE